MSTNRTKTGRSGSSENDLAVNVLMALHRLAKQSTLYDSENQAQLRLLEAVAKAVAAYGRATGENIKISFANKGVFIGKHLLRASRSVYQAARELGELLKPLGIDELAIGFDVPLDDLQQFQIALGAALRAFLGVSSDLAALAAMAVSLPIASPMVVSRLAVPA